jgi:hypothetical protein
VFAVSLSRERVQKVRCVNDCLGDMGNQPDLVSSVTQKKIWPAANPVAGLGLCGTFRYVGNYMVVAR